MQLLKSRAFVCLMMLQQRCRFSQPSLQVEELRLDGYVLLGEKTHAFVGTFMKSAEVLNLLLLLQFGRSHRVRGLALLLKHLL